MESPIQVPDQPIQHTIQLTIKWIGTVNNGFFKGHQDDAQPLLVQKLTVSNGEHPQTILKRTLDHANQYIKFSKMKTPDFFKRSYDSGEHNGPVQTDGTIAWYYHSSIGTYGTYVRCYQLPKTLIFKFLKET